MSIELRDMRWAVMVAQHKSLRQAAEALTIRQSTLSRRLRALEDQIGATLFERNQGGTRLTCAGLEFTEFARRILEDTDTTLRNLRSQSRGENGRLRIGIYACFATGNLHGTLSEYSRRFPGVDVHTVDGSHARLINALGRRAIDVAVMTNSQSAGGYPGLPLWTERIIVALPEGHALAEQDAVTWQQLAEEKMIMPLHGPGPELESLLAAKLNGDKPKRILRQECGLDRLLSLVSTGNGLLLMLEGGVGLTHQSVVYREIREGASPTRLSFSAYWHPTNASTTLEPFLKILRERYPDLQGPPKVNAPIILPPEL